MPTTLVLPLLLGAAFALQPPGPFHGDEPVARDGERWLALRIDGDDAALVETTVNVQAVEDPIHDEAGQRTGREVTSADDAGVVMYLRGAGLRAGRIERAQVGQTDSVATTMPVYELTFRGQRHRIRARCDPAPFEHVERQAHHACRIEFTAADQAHVLARTRGYFEPGATTMSLGDDAAPALMFAGDLDRDGRLDLILDTSDHYNVVRPTLFLSSQALPDAVLREVARFESVGC